jgi:hypothetical protein
MDLEQHVPSLTHLRDFANARSRGRTTHVAQDYMQVTAPSDGRIFAFVYEKFISAMIRYIQEGSRGTALQDCVNDASERMRPSYHEAARGVEKLLLTVRVVDAKRQQRNRVVVSGEGLELVSLRTHLILELENGSKVAAHLHFPREPLTPVETSLMETAVALAVEQSPEAATPAIVLVRAGSLRVVDSEAALTSARIGLLETEVAAYREEWAKM